MKVCGGILNGAQVTPRGRVAQCCYLRTEFLFIGSLLENSLEEIWNGERNRHIFNCLANGDYSVCSSTFCPYLVDGKPKDTMPLVEIDEMPRLPTSFGLSYEYVCNYQCTCCMQRHNEITPEIEAEYQVIEKNLEEILPNLKHITCNGYGEIFASKRTLKLLANWRPRAPKEEVSVQLITNASLFDEAHWKQIENLGQYKVNVQVSVMSFDEHIYQVLSRVKFPISKVVNNLHFIKKLREEGVVNHFTISSVVQDRNFRTMPEFTRRSIEEFNADEVKLQPIVFVNGADFNSWLTDVRGKYHPYHQEYLEVMSDPIFKHPKVVDYGAWNDSETGDLPQNIMLQNERAISNLTMNILSQMVLDEAILNEMAHFIKICGNEAIIFGANSIGITAALKLSRQCNIKYILDLNGRGTVGDIKVVGIDDVPPPLRNVPIIFTDFREPPNLAGYLRSRGYNGAFVGINKFFQLPASS